MNREMETLYSNWEEKREEMERENSLGDILTDALKEEGLKEGLSQYVVKNMESAFIGGFQTAVNLMSEIR